MKTLQNKHHIYAFQSNVNMPVCVEFFDIQGCQPILEKK